LGSVEEHDGFPANIEVKAREVRGEKQKLIFVINHGEDTEF